MNATSWNQILSSLGVSGGVFTLIGIYIRVKYKLSLAKLAAENRGRIEDRHLKIDFTDRQVEPNAAALPEKTTLL